MSNGNKERNDEVVKLVSNAFLEFRRQLTTLISPDLGVIDDITLTWQGRYVAPKKDQEQEQDEHVPKPTKEGNLHLVFYTKTIPEPETGKQVFNSFTVNTTIGFARDLHPGSEEAKKLIAEMEANQKTSVPPVQNSDERDEIIELVTQAAASGSSA